jgi:DNA-binding beta-propeller fold protein YncE
MFRKSVRRSLNALQKTCVPAAALATIAGCSTALHPPRHSVSAAVNPSAYHVARTFQLGGEGGWDVIEADAMQHRLYISRGTHVLVWDTKAEKLVGDIPNTPGVHDIAIVHELNRGFTSNGRDSSVTIFDLNTLATIGVIHGTGRGPDVITYDPVSRRVFTFNGGSDNATVIDPAAGSIVGTVALGGKPEFASPDGDGRMLVNLEDKSSVVKFDTRSLSVIGTWPLAPCEEPTGMAMDAAHHRIFIGCGNKLMAIMDTRTGRVLGTVPAGEGIDGAGYDPRTGLAFTSNGEGTLTVVAETSPDAYGVVATVPTRPRARTMAVDPSTGRIYTVTAEFGTAPAPTPATPRPRAPMIPGSFTLLVIER